MSTGGSQAGSIAAARAGLKNSRCMRSALASISQASDHIQSRGKSRLILVTPMLAPDVRSRSSKFNATRGGESVGCRDAALVRPRPAATALPPSRTGGERAARVLRDCSSRSLLAIARSRQDEAGKTVLPLDHSAAVCRRLRAPSASTTVPDRVIVTAGAAAALAPAVAGSAADSGLAAAASGLAGAGSGSGGAGSGLAAATAGAAAATGAAGALADATSAGGAAAVSAAPGVATAGAAGAATAAAGDAAAMGAAGGSVLADVVGAGAAEAGAEVGAAPTVAAAAGPCMSAAVPT